MDLIKLRKLEDIHQKKEEAKMCYNNSSNINIQTMNDYFKGLVLKKFAAFDREQKTEDSYEFNYKGLNILFHLLKESEIDNDRAVLDYKTAFCFNISGNIFNIIHVFVLPLLNFPSYPDKVYFMSPIDVKIKLEEEELNFYKKSLENEAALKYKFRLKKFNFKFHEYEYLDFVDIDKLLKEVFK